jgi:S-adenosyl-L-methionine hydrolase (adenosine-forming)
MAPPVIAFLTDFGTKDHYAGTVKGVVLSICPEAACVDITHEVPPHDVMAGALELAAAYKYFPTGTVFVVVVDPGVGSARRPIAAEAGGYRFVAPDNGVLTLVFKETPPTRVVELMERRYARPTVSRTFEGRDRFGPAAAWLAKGIELSAFGRTLNDWQTLNVPEPIVTDEEMIVEVVRVDRFGNLVTNVDRRAFDRFVNADRIEIAAGTATVGAVIMTYADADPGALCALFGSSEHLEIAINGGSAAEHLALGRGAKITISKVHQGA